MSESAHTESNRVKVHIVTDRKATGWSLWQWLFGVGLLGLVVLVAGSAVKKKWRTRSRIAQIKKDCRGREAETVLVLVHSHRNGQACARLIHNLFETAMCPWRVSVGVYQEIKDGDVDCFYYYRDKLAPSGVYNFSDRVRVRTVGGSAGTLTSIAEGVRQLHAGEKYALLLTPHAVVASNWDETMISELRTAAVYARSEEPVLTATPTTLGQQYGHISKEGGATSSAVSMMQQFMADAASPAVPEQASHTFITVGEFNHRLPTIGTRRFPHPPARPVRMLALDPRAAFCSFALLRRAVEESPEAFSLPAPAYATPALLSSAMHRAGGAFYSPVRRVVWQASSRMGPRPRGWRSDEAARVLEAAAWPAFAGVDVGKKITSGRARMGLIQPDSGNEILSKYGSMAEFERFRAAFLP
mgnify:CR=1 FL=1